MKQCPVNEWVRKQKAKRLKEGKPHFNTSAFCKKIGVTRQSLSLHYHNPDMVWADDIVCLHIYHITGIPIKKLNPNKTLAGIKKKLNLITKQLEGLSYD